MDVSSIVVSTLAGAIGGGLGALIALALKLEGNARAVPSMVMVGLSLVAAKTWYDTPERRFNRAMNELIKKEPQSGMERYLGYWAQEAKDSPVVRQWFLDSPHKSGQQMQQAARALTQEGVKRLDDETLLSRTRVMRYMIDRASTAVCAAMGRGTVTEAQLAQAMETLDEEELRSFSRVIIRAMEAEIQKTRRSTEIGQAEIQLAFGQVGEALSGAEVERFQQVASNPNGASDEDMCWFNRKLHGLVFSLGEPSNITLAYVLTGAGG